VIILQKADFLSPRTDGVEPVEIQGGGTAYVRVMSGARREAYLSIIRKLETTVSPELEQISATAHIVAASLCDEHGVYFFPRYPKDVTEADLVAIGDKPWFWLDPLVDKVSFLNGFSEAGKAAAKNGSTTATSGSSTGSPSRSATASASS
jgi:hypothetical protein